MTGTGRAGRAGSGGGRAGSGGGRAGSGGDPAAASLIDALGSSEAAWTGWPALRRLPELDVTAWTSAVVLAAHPDDEVLGAGGIISLLAAAGARLRLIAVTDGEASHPGADPAALARRRARERAAALRALGAPSAEVLRLGLPDGGLTGRDGDVAVAIGDLASGFDACLAPWEGDVHGDHEAVGRAAMRVATRVFWYPVWMWHWARPAHPGVPWRQAVQVPLPPATVARKHAAVGCFGSQLEARPGGAEPVLTAGFVDHFARDYELLFREASR